MILSRTRRAAFLWTALAGILFVVMLACYSIGWPKWQEYRFEQRARQLKAGIDLPDIDRFLRRERFVVFGEYEPYDQRHQAVCYQVGSHWYLVSIDYQRYLYDRNMPPIGVRVFKVENPARKWGTLYRHILGVTSERVDMHYELIYSDPPSSSV